MGLERHTFSQYISQKVRKIPNYLKRSSKKPLVILLLAAIPAIGWAGVAQAHDFRTGNSSTVAAGETVDGTLFISGRTIDIAGRVNGDVFCAGQNITITGEVSGDVICAGQTVRVSGKVDGDIRLAGQTVTVGGTVAHNVSAAGQSVTTEASSKVDGDASLAGEDVTVNGQIARDLAVGGDNVSVNSQVGRNIQGGVTNIRLGGNATVGGDIRYTSHNKIQRESDAQVSGTVSQTIPKDANKESSSVSWIWGALWFIVSMLLLALVLVLIMPRAFQRSSNIAMSHLGRTLLVGILASILAPIIIVTLLLTIVGIPLGIVALFAWIVLVIMSGPFAAYLGGRYLLRGRSSNAIWIMLAGGTLLLVVYFIPLIGWIVALLAHWFGVGSILSLASNLRKPQYEHDEADMAVPAEDDSRPLVEKGNRDKTDRPK